MSVLLEPSDVLTFKRPLTRTAKEILTITNVTKQDVAFKVKTTAPKLYCVRPNAGIVPVGESLEVQVMLQPFKEEPPFDQKCKDKFLVQTVPLVNDLKSFELAELWPHVESNVKDLIQQTKLRCNYLNENEKVVTDNSARTSLLESTPKHTTDSTSTPLDDVARLQTELTSYKTELLALRERDASSTVMDTTVTKKNGISVPIVILIALFAFLVPFVLFRTSSA